MSTVKRRPYTSMPFILLLWGAAGCDVSAGAQGKGQDPAAGQGGTGGQGGTNDVSSSSSGQGGMGGFTATSNSSSSSSGQGGMGGFTATSSSSSSSSGQGGMGGFTATSNSSSSSSGQGGAGGAATTSSSSSSSSGQGGAGGNGLPVCGDGILAGIEACDDGNVLSGDGCSSSCNVEMGSMCNGSPSVCSDIDECATMQNNCGVHTDCINTPGAFECVCAAGYGDCDNDPQTGCEVDLTTSATHCGMCNAACIGGTCNGGACTCSSQPGQTCMTGFCADDVCCDTACTAECVACTAAKKGSGMDGTCGPITNYTDPDNDCITNGVCTSPGICFWPGSNGSPCTVNQECVSGSCTDGLCCNVPCTGLCEACTVAQKGSGTDGVCGPIAAYTDPDDECANGVCLSAGTCFTMKADGSACTSNPQCTSGHCVDGVCCDTTCTGLCEACTAAKKGSGTNGTCGPIALNTDPDNECAGAAVCLGTGTCFLPQANGSSCTTTQQCASNYCANGVCCNLPCNGTCVACDLPGSVGTCAPTTTGACSYSCSSGHFGFPAFAHVYFGVSMYDTYERPTAVDMNGDGLVDLVARNGVAYHEGGGTFGPPVVFESSATHAITGDVDGDGDMDIIAKSGNADALLGVWMNLGNGMFGPEVDYLVGMGVKPRLATDLDGDGWTDVVATTSDDKLWVIRNQGNGTFGTGTAYQFSSPFGNGIKDILAGDFKEDGATDLAVRTYDQNDSITLLANLGNGTFSTITTPAPPMSPIASLAAWAKADFNNDGHLDLALASHYNSGQVYIRLGNGIGGFGAAYLTNLPCNNNYITLGAADLDGDGKSDLFCEQSSGPSDWGFLITAMQTGNLTFTTSALVNVGLQPSSIFAADLDADNHQDVIFWDSYSNSIIPLRNNGVGGLDLYRKVVTVATAHTLGDVNGDGLDDLVAIPENTYAAEVWLNQGGGTFTTKTTYTTVGATSSPTLADLDGNGSLDLAIAADKFVTIFLNQGNGSFVPNANYLSATDVVSLVLRDVNGDNKLDILTGEAGTIGVRLNLGNGTFGPATTYAALGADGRILGMDVNDDGFVDILTATCDVPLPARGIWLNQGNGTFVRGANFSMLGDNVIFAPWSSGDLNGDGREDIVIMNYGLFVGLNNGNQSFSTAEVAPSDFAGKCEVGDVTRDGIVDAVCSRGAPFNINLGIGEDGGVNVFPGLGNGTFDFVKRYSGGTRGAAKIGDVNGDGANDIVTAGMLQAGVMINTCRP